MVTQWLLGEGCTHRCSGLHYHPHVGNPSGPKGDAEWKEAKVLSTPPEPPFCLQRKAAIHSLCSCFSNFPVPSWGWEGVRKRLSQMHALKINHARERRIRSCVCSQTGLKYLKHTDSNLSGIGSALGFVSPRWGSTQRAGNLVFQSFRCCLWVCHHNRCVPPSKEKSRLDSPGEGGNSPSDPASRAFEIPQRRLVHSFT